MGYSRETFLEKSPSARKESIILVLICLIIIITPLSYNGYNVTMDNLVTQTVTDASVNWLEGSGYELESVDIQSLNNNVMVTIIGNGPLPPIEKLEKQIKGKIHGKNIEVDVLHSDTYLVTS